MAERSLTPKGIKALKATGAVYRVYDRSDDPDLRGFHVVVSANGVKSYALGYTGPADGKRKFVTLGSAATAGQDGDKSLVEARRAARELRQRIAKGEDPQAERKAARTRQATAPTFAVLVEWYLKSLEGKRSHPEVKRCLERDAVPRFGDQLAAAVTSDDVLDAVAVVRQRGSAGQAKKVKSYLYSAFEFGRTAHLDDAWRGRVPRFGIAHNPAWTPKRKKREPGEGVGSRWLSKDELITVWREFGAKRTVTAGYGAQLDVDPVDLRAALRLLQSTGQRVEEVLEARWSEFDQAAKVWEIPGERRKTGVAHVVPLEPLHLALLKELSTVSTGELLFPSADDAKVPRSAGSLRQAIDRYCRRAKVARFTPRDCRRTWKTLAGAAGLSLDDRNRIQGHAFGDVGSTSYDRWDYLPQKKRAMAKWCRWLEAAIADKPAKVVAIRGGAA